jgi:hypothetical protein
MKPFGVVQQYVKEAEMNSFIRLNVRLFHFDNRDMQSRMNLEQIKSGNPYAVVLHHHDVVFQAMITDKDGNLLGEIENPFPGIQDHEFVAGLVGVLNAVTNLDGLSNTVSMTKPLVLKNASISNLNENFMELKIPAQRDDFGLG